MANKHLKKVINFSSPQKTSIKITVQCHTTAISLAQRKNTDNIRSDSMEQWELPCIAGRGVNEYSHFGKLSWQVYTKESICPCHLTQQLQRLEICPTEMLRLCTKRHDCSQQLYSEFPNGSSPKCPSTRKCINTLSYIHTMGCNTEMRAEKIRTLLCNNREGCHGDNVEKKKPDTNEQTWYASIPTQVKSSETQTHGFRSPQSINLWGGG